uniref:Putative chaperone n=1 Tax=viral metagenome TaxID=1070528 RepID=A0A6M3JZ80_9ZZZZ
MVKNLLEMVREYLERMGADGLCNEDYDDIDEEPELAPMCPECEGTKTRALSGVEGPPSQYPCEHCGGTGLEPKPRPACPKCGTPLVVAGEGSTHWYECPRHGPMDPKEEPAPEEHTETMWKIGRARAGRTLDGEVHDGE